MVPCKVIANGRPRGGQPRTPLLHSQEYAVLSSDRQLSVAVVHMSPTVQGSGGCGSLCAILRVDDHHHCRHALLNGLLGDPWKRPHSSPHALQPKRDRPIPAAFPAKRTPSSKPWKRTSHRSSDVNQIMQALQPSLASKLFTLSKRPAVDPLLHTALLLEGVGQGLGAHERRV